MKNKKIIGLIVVLIILIGGAYLLGKNSKKDGVLPDSFTIEVRTDNSSSGADRKYDGELTFKGNKLINGFQNYYVGEGAGCTVNCERTTKCIIKNGEWAEISGGECKIEKFIPLTKGEIEQQILSKEIISSEDFSACHRLICYKLK